MKFISFAAEEVGLFLQKNPVAVSDENYVKMMTFPFQYTNREKGKSKKYSQKIYLLCEVFTWWRVCCVPVTFTSLWSFNNASLALGHAADTKHDHWSYHCRSTKELILAKIGVLIIPITGAINLLKVIQNGCYLVDNIFVFILKRTLLNFYSNLTTIGSQGPVKNSPAQIEIMAWCQTGKKPLAETNDWLRYWRTSYGCHSMILTAYDNPGESKPWCDISMAQCKAAITSLLTHGSHWSLAPSHRYDKVAIIETQLYRHWWHRRLSLWQSPVTAKLT